MNDETPIPHWRILAGVNRTQSWRRLKSAVAQQPDGTYSCATPAVQNEGSWRLRLTATAGETFAFSAQNWTFVFHRHPQAVALAIKYSSLRVLLPPVARPVQSSRLSQMRGPANSWLNRSNGSNGVGA